MYARTLCFLIFGTCCITGIACGWYLIYVHKTRYRNLWEREKKKDSIWIPYERIIVDGLFWETPYWIKQEKDALVVLRIYRACHLFGLASFIGFIYFSLEKIN